MFLKKPPPPFFFWSSTLPGGGGGGGERERREEEEERYETAKKTTCSEEAKCNITYKVRVNFLQENRRSQFPNSDPPHRNLLYGVWVCVGVWGGGGDGGGGGGRGGRRKQVRNALIYCDSRPVATQVN